MHRLSESRSLPSPRGYSQLALNTAFVPMSFIFHFVRAPVSRRDEEAGTAARTLWRGSRASQATSERVEELTKATCMLSACFEYSICTYEFYFSLGRAPVSGTDAGAGTAARTLLRGSRASQATSERV